MLRLLLTEVPKQLIQGDPAPAWPFYFSLKATVVLFIFCWKRYQHKNEVFFLSIFSSAVFCLALVFPLQIMWLFTHYSPFFPSFSLPCFGNSTFSNLIPLLKFYTCLSLKRDTPKKVYINKCKNIKEKKQTQKTNHKNSWKIICRLPSAWNKVFFLLQHTALHYPTGRNTPAPFQR